MYEIIFADKNFISNYFKFKTDHLVYQLIWHCASLHSVDLSNEFLHSGMQQNMNISS